MKVLAVLVVFLCLTSVALAADQYKPFLHKPALPQHPAVKLYGEYASDLYSGSATYTYVIDAPKGVNGLQPSVGIYYSSAAAKQRPGVLGSGWSMSYNYIYRDVNATPANVSDDFFIMVLDSNVYNFVYYNGSYHTGVEYYYRLENISDYWVLTKQDGKKYRFGSTSDALVKSPSGTSMRWALDLVNDTHGNTITYIYVLDPYAEDTGSQYLDSITYNSDGLRRIDFTYESKVRTDRWRVYQQGMLLEESRRLSDITISVAGEQVRRDQFSYVQLFSGVSALASIAKFGANDSLLYNISFSYYNADAGYYNATDWKPPVLFSDSTTHKDYGARVMDINNDGFADIVQHNGTSRVWLNNRTNWTLASWSVPVQITDSSGVDQGVRFDDVNNDGFVDMLSAKAGSTRRVYLNNGSGWRNVSWTVPVDVVTKTGVDLGVNLADVNGDGFSDIIKANVSTRTVYLSNGSGWVSSSWSVPADFVNSSGDTGVRLFDANGDGLPDLVQSVIGSVQVWLNNGSGWVLSTWTVPAYFITAAQPDTGVRFIDANGDGLTDILQGYVNGTTKTYSTWMNNGSGWKKDTAWNIPEPFTKDGYNFGRRLADVDGDGFADVIVSLNSSGYTVLKNRTITYLLRAVKNEYGSITNLTYVPSTAFNNTVNNRSQLGFAIYVLNTSLKQNGMNESFETAMTSTYSYAFGSYNHSAQEFRGFGVVVENTSSRSVEHGFHQDAALKGKEYARKVYDYTGLLFSAKNVGYSYILDHGIYNVSLVYVADFLYDGSVVVVNNKSFFYNRLGNYEYIVDHGDVNTTGDERFYNYSYAFNTADWIVNKVARETISDSSGNVRETSYYYDGRGLTGIGSLGELTKKEEWNNGNNSFTYYEYDSVGNLVRRTDNYGNTERFTYEVTDTYPLTYVNALGHITTYTYNSSTGNLLSEEKNGITTSYEYDTFGRILREIKPYDSHELPTQVYDYDFDGYAPERITIRQRTSADKYMNTSFYYDGFADLVQLKSDVEDGQQIVKNIFYDSEFRPVAEQNPYFATVTDELSNVSTTANITNYTYDVLDRIVFVRNPDGSNLTTVFSGRNVTDYDANGHRHLYVLDSYGRIVKVHEYNTDPVLNTAEEYVTTYAYDGNDNLVEIVDNEGNIFSFTYDSLGRKTSMTDPDMGTWTYKYDLNGNLISQSGSAAGIISGDGYYREYNEFNQLVRLRNGSTNSSPIIEEYFYDQNGERIKIQKHDSAHTVVYMPFRDFMMIKNDSGEFNYTYVYQDNVLVARLNPDGTKQFYHTDHLGSVSIVTDENGVVLENISYAPYGEVLSGGTKENKLYTGQYRDTADQYYFGARYYDPTVGQFQQADTLIANIYDPQNLNHYSYVLNNPYKYTDPDGHNPYLVAGVVGFSAATVYYGYTHQGEGRGANFFPYMARGLTHGTIGAAAAISSTALIINGGRVSAGASGTGQASVAILAKQFAIGASTYVLHQTVDEDPLNGVDAFWSGVTNTLNFIPLQPGTYVSSSDVTLNSLKIGGNQLSGDLLGFINPSSLSSGLENTRSSRSGGYAFNGLSYGGRGINRRLLSDIIRSANRGETMQDLFRRWNR